MKWIKYISVLIIVFLSVFGQRAKSQITNEHPLTSNVFNNSDITTFNISTLDFELLAPVSGYSNDFENESLDIFSSDFEVSSLPGINSQVLHTAHPYPESQSNDCRCDLIAQLMHPIILKSNEILKFDEIVLVEPDESSTKSNDVNSGDFVIVEASKNNGESWQPLIEGYNSDADDVWYHIFTNSLVENQSWGEGKQSIFKQRTITLTDNINFFENDTILIRFRLSSDHTINGWGWAIDNINIEQNFALADDSFIENFKIYPNPFANYVNIDCTNNGGPDKLDLIITNLSGKIVFRENQISCKKNSQKEIDLSGLKSGIYLLIITDNSYYSKTKKIIKN